MNAWWDSDLVAFDTETTGVDTATDRIVTASLVFLHPGKRPAPTSYLIAIDVDIPSEAQAVHGIRTAYAREYGQPAAQVLDAIAIDVAMSLHHGVPILGFNLAFDLTMLENELRRHDLPTLAERLDGRITPIVDAHVLDKFTDPYRKGSRKLLDVCSHHKVLHGGAHEAAADALAAARLAVVLVRGNASLATMSLPELHDAQVAWRREQSESLAKYFARKGQRQHVCPCWPVCAGDCGPVDAAVA